MREVLEAEALDAIVVAPAMAAPPGLGVVALGERPPPVVIWNAIAVDGLSDEAETGEAVEHTTSVGCLMLAGALARNGMRAAVLTTAPGDADALSRLHRTVRAAAAAGSLRGRTVVRIGEPPPGYVNVLAEAPELAHLGLAPAYVGRSDLDEAFAAATPADASAVLDELAEAGLAAERGPVAERSARLARAIETLLDEHAALCGAVNCLGPLLAQSDTIGTVACLAALRETARGRALACTADVPAAVAMHLGRRLGGAVLYGEWYTSEAGTDTGLFLGDGNADPAWADPEHPPRLVETQLRGIHAPGVGLAATLRRGPATLLGARREPRRLAARVGHRRGRRRALRPAARPQRPVPGRRHPDPDGRLAPHRERHHAPPRAGARLPGRGGAGARGRARRAGHRPGRLSVRPPPGCGGAGPRDRIGGSPGIDYEESDLADRGARRVPRVLPRAERPRPQSGRVPRPAHGRGRPHGLGRVHHVLAGGGGRRGRAGGGAARPRRRQGRGAERVHHARAARADLVVRHGRRRHRRLRAVRPRRRAVGPQGQDPRRPRARPARRTRRTRRCRPSRPATPRAPRSPRWRRRSPAGWRPASRA